MHRDSTPPLVSIVVPSFNQGRYIAETLESCLNQDYDRMEVLVVDGGSTDSTLDVLKGLRSPKLRWWSEPDRGVVDAVNKGLERAGGAILSVQSSDDVFVEGAVTSAVDALARDPSVGVVYADVEHIDADSTITGRDVQSGFRLDEYLGRLMYVPQPGTFFTRDVLTSVGPWRHEFSYAADADFWLRAATRFTFRKLDRIAARYRYHDEQRDRQRARIARDWEGAVRDLIASGRLSRREQRFARMGIHLARYRYADDADWRGRTASLYAAFLANPPAVADDRFPRRELLPGREPIWRALSRAKRWLGFRPRSA